MTRVVYIDTNILQALSNVKSALSTEAALTFIKNLDLNIDFYVTFFHKYEFLRGIDSKVKLGKNLSIVKKFDYLVPEDVIFDVSRFIFLIYKKLLKLEVSEGDLILAAYNFYHKNSYILTINTKDFPSSYFECIKKFPIVNKNGIYVTTAALLSIDRELMIKAYNSVFKQ